MLPRIGITTSPGTNGDRPADVLNHAYVDAVADVGGLPILLPILAPSFVDAILDSIDGLVLSGGGDVDPACYGQTAVPEVSGVDQARDAWELPLVRAAMARGVPVLGICRGSQVLNVACGGTLVQDLPSITDHIHRANDRWGEVVHPVEVDPTSKLADAVGTESVGANTLHHQAVADVGDGLRAVAWAQDGTVEAIESDDARAVLGVQWHPELLTDHDTHRRLFAWVVAAASASIPVSSPSDELASDDDELAVA
jgi:putative glutamine amidotransferase